MHMPQAILEAVDSSRPDSEPYSSRQTELGTRWIQTASVLNKQRESHPGIELLGSGAHAEVDSALVYT